MSSIRKNFILKEAFSLGICDLQYLNNSIEYFEEGLDIKMRFIGGIQFLKLNDWVKYFKIINSILIYFFITCLHV